MDILTIIIIAIGLAMDCFAISIAQGLSADTCDADNCPKPILMALLFGLFQGGMPLISYYAGYLFAEFFRIYAPWIALILLAFIGGKMAWESLHKKEEKPAGWHFVRLLILAIATSIDALATGVIFIPTPDKIWTGIAIIGLTSLIFSFCGYHVGRLLGKRFKLNVELIGGIILIAVGFKIWATGYLCL
ncbi:MAG: manganese efflux pump MntP family protein [Paludibacteraceae bacterium]|nr:manganese efflux pump MntP family protein [Paludibacteraceae bacterium]